MMERPTRQIQRGMPAKEPLRGLKGVERLRAIRRYKQRSRWYFHWRWMDLNRAFTEYAERRRSDLLTVGIIP